ncbi:MAG: hypothetical protein HY238_08940 [Acidobacteria bacterium]|nr:hypothetical protein [Acidobacteriota bacterium]
MSVHPFTGQRGATFVATVRGNGLREATSVFLEHAPLTVAIEGTEAEPPNETTAKSKTPFDLVHLRIQVAADAKPGRYPFRLVTPHGVSNALPIHITAYPVAAEPAGLHETFNGRILRRGESDYYAFDVKAGETLTFEVISGLSSIGAPGGNAVGFDPSLTIFEPSGSWFDPKRINRVAFNDEPLWVIGRPTDAYLVHKFERAGRYLLRVEAFSGQGGPDYSYQLKIIPGEAPQDLPPARETWNERAFSRRLSAGRLNELAARGGTPQNQKSIETYRAGQDAPFFKLPGTLEGGLAEPGEAHRARFHLDGPQDIAIEVETPAAAPPLFNPIIRLLNAAGEEVATNVFAGRGACTGALNKSLQAKAIVPMREAGDYTVEIRDTTSDLAGPDFRYRVQVRPQIPHVGQVNIDADHINLRPGEAKTIRVIFDREEDYRGAIAVAAESLPPGIQALAGADFEPDKDPPLYRGKRERYTPRTEHSVVVFAASAGAVPMQQPQVARLVVRPVADGKPGAVVATKQFPVMVISKP